MSTKNPRTEQRSPRVTRVDQRGMVSIMVTMILMIVMSLIVVGFAQVSRRNQRTTLDRQLSTQAFYAAESGINDARNRINEALRNNEQISSKKSCTDTGSGGFYASLNPVINATNNVSYSCLLVNAAPKQLSYDDISTTGTVIPLISETGNNLSSLKLVWQPKTGVAAPNGNCQNTATRVFTPTADWDCNYGVMRVDVVPVNGNRTADQLQTDSRTYFIMPYQQGASHSSPRNNTTGSSVLGANCSAAGCEMVFNNLNANQYYMRVSSIYLDHSLKVSATETGGAPAGLLGAQVIIDATGKAQDVLRRVQVHVPITGSGSHNKLPDHALQSTDSVCKRYSVMENYFSNGAEIDGNNAYCQP